MDVEALLNQIEEMFPDADCELNHTNAFELLVAVVLSAQTTDASVNKVTPNLFEKFPTPIEMANADISEIEDCIRSIGLYRNKAKSLKALSQSLIDQFDGEVPSSKKALISLAGVGVKTANVVQSVWFNIPAIAVDTHVERVSKRLGLAKVDDSVTVVEAKLKRKIKRERWSKAHHLLIFFGRYYCTAKNPHCSDCPLITICKKSKLDKKGKDKNKMDPVK